MNPVTPQRTDSGQVRVLGTCAGPPVHCLALSPCKTQLAAGCGDGTLRVFDSGSGALCTEVAAHTSAISSLCIVAGGLLASASALGATLSVWQVADHDAEPAVQVWHEDLTASRLLLRDMTVIGDGEVLACFMQDIVKDNLGGASVSEPHLQFRDPLTGRERDRMPAPVNPNHGQRLQLVSMGGNLLAVFAPMHRLWILDVQRQCILHEFFQDDFSAVSMAITPLNGNTIALDCAETATVSLLTVPPDGKSPIATVRSAYLPAHNYSKHLMFSPRGSHLLVASMGAFENAHCVW